MVLSLAQDSTVSENARLIDPSKQRSSLRNAKQCNYDKYRCKALPERMLVYQGILVDSSTHTVTVYHIDAKQDGGGVRQLVEPKEYMKLLTGHEEAVTRERSSHLVYPNVLTQIFEMSNYKLTYFNITGLAEPIRYLLHQSGIKFEDQRLTPEEWSAVKSGMPMGQVPVLEIDGKKYHQSKSIGRYLARKNNLVGSNDEEAYQIDATIDTIDELRLALAQHHWEKDPALKEKFKAGVSAKFPSYLDKLEEQVKKNGGHFVGGKLTWADLHYAAQSETLSGMLQHDVNKDHPELKKLVEKVRSLPNIKSYLESRPKTVI
ncbi:Glutathione S-transferase S1 [Eufriesea mexicana]|uniref:glutathione transferase n=1 Tax=Eufriesea mexicana TaxID=516756 RepID=A0A310SC04_9HYME|nr:Glutathione S-transferase S1 [Eufriesea mexicana]